ncbi:Unconventional myosin-Ib [Bulinus truncatus]|nr:Unconventional myosin-Ib [Bulinus truncatus]
MALHLGTLQIFENNVGVSDAVLLDPMTEEAFIDNLEKRFQHQQIYTDPDTVMFHGCGSALDNDSDLHTSITVTLIDSQS